MVAGYVVRWGYGTPGVGRFEDERPLGDVPLVGRVRRPIGGHVRDLIDHQRRYSPVPSARSGPLDSLKYTRPSATASEPGTPDGMLIDHRVSPVSVSNP